MTKLNIEEIATKSIQLYAEINNLSEQLESNKEVLREVADGEKLDITVANLGKLQVKTPAFTPAKQFTRLAFDESAYQTLDDKTKKLLQKHGVVLQEEVKTPAKTGKAAVTITLNV